MTVKQAIKQLEFLRDSIHDMEDETRQALDIVLAAVQSNDSLTEPSAFSTDPSREIEEDGFITWFFDR